MDAQTLLIVEDSPTQAKIIRQQFESLTGFTLLNATTLAEVDALIGQHGNEIFAVVTDLNLPDAPNGETVDFCTQRGIPCVVLAASFDPELRRRLIEKRVADYFLKGTVNDLEPLITSVQRIHKNRQVRALVVDDSPTQRGLVKDMLAVQCIQSLEAGDGLEALELLRDNPDIRLVITDYEMPRMNGIDLIHELRGKHKLTSLAVIGVSSAGSGALTARFLKNGANDFLTKPFEIEEFYWRVNQTLNILDATAEIRALKSQS